MWPVYLFAYSMAGNFIYSLILHGDSIYLINFSGPLFYGSNLYVIGKENVLSLLSVMNYFFEPDLVYYRMR